jgi:flagellar operon protein
MPDPITEVQKPQGQVDVDRLRRAQQPLPTNSSPSFAEVLTKQVKQTTADVRFSTHAMDRLRSRNILLTSEDSMRLRGAVDKVAQKGSRESLVLMDNLAFVVSVNNRTVITAVDGSNLRENVFTNIDSAILV